MIPTVKKKSKLLVVLCTMVAAFVIQSCDNQSTFDKALVQSASELNKMCPMMVDAETRLDNAIALPNKVFQYNYTLINVVKDSINIEELTGYLKPNIINNVSTNPDLKEYRDNGVTMVYFYKDKDGVFLTKIEVTPDLYKD